ncbi:MAG: hypothetical protein Q8918_09890 [Bacteroidota bacterium]|nr:hypothetical protein [Bacteroidota bacterium]MDP4211724.1 hypothetical protein [Bacteroidota bacterium]MDP4250404.1 hypothetical protein [Bacteroidota bacterium]
MKIPILQIMLFVITVSGIKAQTPLLNSYPPAAATVYLDFDGATVEGTLWNEQGKIIAESAGFSPATIAYIHKKIAEHFILFNLNITTDPAVYERAPIHQRTRIIITPKGSWYGPAPGVSAVGSFVWGDDTPAWVFTDHLSNNPLFIAAAATHQIGHTLGLQHQSLYDSYGIMISELSGGENNIFSNEAPLMGIPFYKTADWSNGTSSTGARDFQSDTALIAGEPNEIGYRRKSVSSETHISSPDAAVKVQTQLSGSIDLNSTGDYNYRLFDISGRLLTQGNLKKGWNQIQAGSTANAVLVLQWYGETGSGSQKILR